MLGLLSCILALSNARLHDLQKQRKDTLRRAATTSSIEKSVVQYSPCCWQVVENVLNRTTEKGSKFAEFEAEIRCVITQQEAELTMSTIYAASKGDLDHLKELIRAGANPSKPDYDGRSPLVCPVYSWR